MIRCITDCSELVNVNPQSIHWSLIPELSTLDISGDLAPLDDPDVPTDADPSLDRGDDIPGVVVPELTSSCSSPSNYNE